MEEFQAPAGPVHVALVAGADGLVGLQVDGVHQFRVNEALEDDVTLLHELAQARRVLGEDVPLRAVRARRRPGVA